MPYALLSLTWTSVVLLFVVLISGLKFFPVAAPLRLHVVLGLTGVTVALFAHTMTMFYFIGTGKKIKEFVSTWESSFQEETRRRIVEMKRKIFPGMTLACLVLMAAFILGGAADARLIPRATHGYFAMGALVFHVHVSTRETLYLFRNIALIEEINDQARRRSDPAPGGPAA